MNFKEFKLNKKILDNIEQMGFTSPTEIQKLAIPEIMTGKDIIGLAQTGTGKTAAFALPIINQLINQHHHDLEVLILCPTRELATQNKENIIKFSNGTDIRCISILGGVNIKRQVDQVRKGVHILVATPGRLVDLLKQKKINLSQVKTVVLDEADTMFDMGFIRDVQFILSNTNKERQTLLFSATMSKDIMKLVEQFMHQPITIKTANADISIDKIEQELYYIDSKNKFNLLLELLSTKNKPKTLIFTRTKHGADKLSKNLEEYNLKTSVIHSNKRQSNRVKALNDFKKDVTQILIATDIASRGIDISDITLVINYDLPEQAEVYVHRIGRTARAGKEGKAITLCSSGEIPLLKGIEKWIHQKIKVIENSKYPMVLKEETKVHNRKTRTGSSSNHLSHCHKPNYYHHKK